MKIVLEMKIFIKNGNYKKSKKKIKVFELK